MLLFDFSDATACTGWYAIDDRVMGGASGSVLRPSGSGTAVFSGTVSLDNNGGFASVRSPESEFHLGGCDGIELAVFGDGRGYKLNLRTAGLPHDVRYQAAVQCAAGRWDTVRIPFRRFTPVLRGRPLADLPPVDPGNLRTVGFVIADGREGSFRLEIRSVSGYRVTP